MSTSAAIAKPVAKRPAKPAHGRRAPVEGAGRADREREATMAAEKQNQVLFKVLRDATKPEIKAAVELMFKVDVESVSTVVQKGKAKRFGKSMGRRDHIKKAYVSIKKGQELNFSGEGA